MKLVCLNTWGGKKVEELLQYIQEKIAEGVDVFCLQEVVDSPGQIPATEEIRIHFLKDLRKVLKDYFWYYSGTFDGPAIDKRVGDVFILHPTEIATHGSAIFIKKNLVVEKYCEFNLLRHRVYGWSGKEGDPLPAKAQMIDIFNADNRLFRVINVHGLWNGKGKSDTSERLEQSKKLSMYMKGLPTVLAGDLNLDCGTESIRILEKHARNLIREFGVKSTRSKLYKRGRSSFADYIFTTEQVVVDTFGVRDREVSDHLPLELEFHV